VLGFEPSVYSGPPSYGEEHDDYGWAQLVGMAISAGAGIATTAIGARSARKTQASAQRHARKMAKEQEKLIALESEQILAQAAATRASAALAEGSTQRTAMIVGGVLLAVGMVASAIVISKRRAEEDYEEEYEE